MIQEACPVCRSTNTKSKYNTQECVVHLCLDCSHLFTPQSSIINPENYSLEYYQKTHKNWFESPHFQLFDLIADEIQNYFNSTVNLAALKVLDVGCGTCQLLSYLATKYGFEDLSGIDIMNMDFCAPSNIGFYNEDFMTHSPIEKYDVILSTLVIEHIFDVRKFLTKIKSLLSPSGIAIIVTNDCAHPLYLSSRLLEKISFHQPLQRMFSSHHVNHFTKKTLELLSSEVNFTHSKTLSVPIPYNCLDIPSENLLQELLYPPVVYSHLLIGRILNHKFLQLQIYQN